MPVREWFAKWRVAFVLLFAAAASGLLAWRHAEPPALPPDQQAAHLLAFAAASASALCHIFLLYHYGHLNLRHKHQRFEQLLEAANKERVEIEREMRASEVLGSEHTSTQLACCICCFTSCSFVFGDFTTLNHFPKEIRSSFLRTACQCADSPKIRALHLKAQARVDLDLRCLYNNKQVSLENQDQFFWEKSEWRRGLFEKFAQKRSRCEEVYGWSIMSGTANCLFCPATDLHPKRERRAQRELPDPVHQERDAAAHEQHRPQQGGHLRPEPAGRRVLRHGCDGACDGRHPGAVPAPGDGAAAAAGGHPEQAVLLSYPGR